MKRFVALLAVVAVLLTACGGAKSGSETKPADTAVQNTAAGKKLFPLVVTSGGLCICHAPLYVGMSKGIFAKHGLEVSFKQVKSGFEAMGALHTGDANVADAVVAVAAQAAGQGVKVTAVLPANGDPAGKVDTSMFFAVIARPDAGIVAGNLASLKGKKIGVPTGTIGHQYLYLVLQKNGMDATKDVVIQQVAPPDLPSALQSKSVDAIVAWEPIPLNTLNLVKGSFAVVRGGQAMEYLFLRWMSPTFIKEHPQETEAFVAAFAESMQYARKNPEETAKIVTDAMKPIDGNVVKEALSYLNFDPRVSKQSMDSATQGLQFAKSAGTLKTEFDFPANFDQSFIKKVMKDHPEYFADLPAIPADKEIK